MLIDLSSWYENALAFKIERIRNAIEEKQELSFTYYSPRGESRRQIEPYYLIFKWASWYVWGWCSQREAFRLFKLNRMEELCCSGNYFEGRECPLPDLSERELFSGGIEVKALFKPECKWKLVEEYGPGCFVEQEDGRLLFRSNYVNKDYLLKWFFSFRDNVEVLEPEEIRTEIRELLKKMQKMYA